MENPIQEVAKGASNAISVKTISFVAIIFVVIVFMVNKFTVQETFDNDGRKTGTIKSKFQIKKIN